MKKFTDDIASTISTWMSSDEVKAFIESTKSASDADTGTFEMVITTENLDRYQEVIKMDGWDISHYMKNAVVLWGHDHNIIVGMTTSLEIVDGKMVAKGRFAPTEAGQEKRKLYDLGFLKASSVGFIEKEREGNLITKAELIEWSFVSVPANPYALTLAMEKGLNINDLVTKGIFSIKETETEVVEPTVTLETEAQPDAGEVLAERVASLVISKLKDANVVFEGQETAPEHNDAEPVATDETTDESPEDAQLREFSENRKKLQDVATLVCEVLAESRKAIEARRS
jgi:phage head maturation protease